LRIAQQGFANQTEWARSTNFSTEHSSVITATQGERGQVVAKLAREASSLRPETRHYMKGSAVAIRLRLP